MKHIGNLVGITGSLIFSALGFFLLSNNFYLQGGVFVDYSPIAWLLMIGLWIWGGVWLKWRGDWKVLNFAAVLSVVCFGFDCWRFRVYGVDVTLMRRLIWLVGGGLTAVGVVSAMYKQRFLAELCFVAAGIMSVGNYVTFSWYFGVPSVYLLAVGGVWSCIWLFLGKIGEKKQVWLSLAAGVIGGCLVLARWYTLQPGIRFYEFPVRDAAKEVKVSVVVPVYNGEAQLRRCLDSLRHQSLKDIEIIAVNDGSSDGSLKILEEYAAFDKRIRVISQENQFIGAARNTGIGAAKGEFIGFVDQDDKVAENYYEALYNAAKRENTNVAIAGKVYVVKNGMLKKHLGGGVNKFFENKQRVNDFVGEIMKAHIRTSVWDKIYKRSYLQENRVLSSTLRMLYEDGYFFVRAMAPSDDVAVAEDAVYYYYRGHISHSKRGKKVTFGQEAENLILLLEGMKGEVLRAALAEEKQEVWFNVLAYFRRYYLTNYYKALNAEGKALFKARVNEVFSADKIDFEALGEDGDDNDAKEN